MRLTALTICGVISGGTVSCTEVGPHLILTLSIGGEADALTRAPAPTKVEIDADDGAGTSRSLARTTPRTRFDLGPVDRGTLLSISFRAKDDAGKVLLTGTSLPLEVDAVGDEAPTTLFVQRTGELARLPGALTITSPSPLVDRLSRRYVAVAAGDRAELFDLATFRSSTFALPFGARSIVATTAWLLVLDDARAAIVDLAGTNKAVAAPPGLDFAEVAGGAVLKSAAGVSYVVGGTRDRASTAILRVGIDGALSVLRSAVPRAAAAATFVETRGVLIVGGATAESAAEVVNDSGVATALAYPPSPPTNLGSPSAAVALDDRRAVVMGGGVPPRVFDLACAASCTTGAFGVDVPALSGLVDLARAADGSVLALTTDAGHSALVRVRESSPSSLLPLKVERAGARLVSGALPSLLVVGGAAELESFASD